MSIFLDYWAGLFKARLANPGLATILISFFVAFQQGVLFMFFALQF